jgi:predicted AlkP superfamily pyrophosphatase or phosphodiesterase
MPFLMRIPILVLTLLLSAVLLAACDATAEQPSDPGDASAYEPTVILISLDGFMPAYLERHDTPNLDRIADTGVRAEALITSFPTKTFPNHYTVVTGLYPANHGIISNNMYDPEMDERFGLSIRDAVMNPAWWGGEPIWVTAERQDVRAGTFFWPGSEAPIGGIRPTHWLEYQHNYPNEERVEKVLEWLDLPVEERPRFITLYFSEVDSRGHRFGPNSDEVAEAVVRADALIGQLMDGLAERGLLDVVNVIITSDHGMAETSPDRVIILDDYLNPRDLRIIDHSPVMMAEPTGISLAEALDALRQAPHLRVFHRDSLPEEWHFAGHPRIPSLIAVADEGWEIASRSYFERNRDRYEGGTHGYPPEVSSMHAIFLAAGPAFVNGIIVEPFVNVHLYNLMAAILDLEPAPNDGDFEMVRPLLVNDTRPEEVTN